MSEVLELLRPDLRDFVGYASARRIGGRGSVWLNANESPTPSTADDSGGLHRYPDPQPVQLRERMAAVYGVPTQQLLVTRGSDEGIDLLVRAFCRAGVDSIATAPPSFGMYAVCARIQGAALVEIPLLDSGTAWSLDSDGVLQAVANQSVRLVFLCSPANPTGQALELAQIAALADGLRGRAVLVIDEAYAEFSAQASASALLAKYSNLVVLRTLSKAHALAGARIGALLAAPGLVAMLGNLSAPYPIPAPSAAVALAALSDDCLTQARLRCAATLLERERLRTALQTLTSVRTVYPSDGNFLLLRCLRAQLSLDALQAAGIVVRDMRAVPRLGDALRVTVGSVAENDQLLDALRGVGA